MARAVRGPRHPRDSEAREQARERVEVEEQTPSMQTVMETMSMSARLGEALGKPSAGVHTSDCRLP